MGAKQANTITLDRRQVSGILKAAVRPGGWLFSEFYSRDRCHVLGCTAIMTKEGSTPVISSDFRLLVNSLTLISLFRRRWRTR